MEKTITFTMTENQAMKFEKLLDEFNAVSSRQEENENEKQSASKLEAETNLLISQAKEELKKIRQINSSQTKMIWER